MLDGFFTPNAVAVVGASRDETKVGFGQCTAVKGQ